MKKFLLWIALAFVSSSVFAMVPTNGMWYSQSEPGRGFTIDQQNEFMYVTAYVYTPSGAATWFLAIGKYDNATQTFRGELGAYTGGQCLGCSHSKAVGASAGGQVTITFDSTETATLTYPSVLGRPSGSTKIQRQVFGYANKNDYLLGAWSFTMEHRGQLSSQWFNFDGHYTGDDGTVYAKGESFTSIVGDAIALGSYYPSQHMFIVIAQGNDGYTYQYIFPQVGDRRMLGLGGRTIGSGTANPTQLSVASRISFPVELSSASAAPATQASLMSGPNTSMSRFHELEMILREAARSYDPVTPSILGD